MADRTHDAAERVRFLEARAHDDATPARVVVQGAPWDGSVSYRAGAKAAPDEIRVASDSIESYSPVTKRDLLDIDLADAGDVDLNGCDAETALERIAARTEALLRTGARVVTFGGDHSVSIATSRAVRAVHENVVHIVYDAHMDLRAEYDGTEWSHACGSRHMALNGPTAVLGVRSGSREEYSDAEKLLTVFTDGVELPPAMRAVAANAPVFLSVDLDVLDPSILPGTGTPEPGGPTYKELRKALLDLAGLNIVAIDFVEVAPPIDSSGLSPVVAAEIARDCILGLL